MLRAVCAFLLVLTACSGIRADMSASSHAAEATLIRRLIAAAERKDHAVFNDLIASSTVLPDKRPPELADVDRTDEGCTLKQVNATLLHMPEAIWRCPNNFKHEVERRFLIERGRVTHMWNDWQELPF